MNNPGQLHDARCYLAAVPMQEAVRDRLAVPKAPRQWLEEASLRGFPLAVIDFEASALTLDSYPIEVGIAIMSVPNGEIENRSSLIRPDPRWDLDGQWDPDAAKIHGIRRWDLREGLPAAAVLQKLNARIPHGVAVWCDGGHYDEHWLNTLATTASISPSFRLADLGSALHDAQLRARYLGEVSCKIRPHRAGEDAAQIIEAIARAIVKNDRLDETIPRILNVNVKFKDKICAFLSGR